MKIIPTIFITLVATASSIQASSHQDICAKSKTLKTELEQLKKQYENLIEKNVDLENRNRILEEENKNLQNENYYGGCIMSCCCATSMFGIAAYSYYIDTTEKFKNS